MTLEQLQAERAALLDPLDIPGDWTPRQRNNYEAKRLSLDRRILVVRDATETLAKLEPKLPPEHAWLAQLTAWRAPLCDELLACPSPARTSHERGTQQNLTLSILVIDRGLGVVTGTGYVLETLRLGALMRESGYVAGPPIEGQVFGRLPWSGSMPEVEDRIKQLTQRIAKAQAQLAEALLDDAERERLAAESQARRDALNALPNAERAAALAALEH